MSDLLIWLAYLAIPVVLVYFVRRRRDMPFPRIFWMFGLFIVSCGTTHLMEVVTYHAPVYWLTGLVKLFTAVVSLATVFALIPITPRALALPAAAAMNTRLQQKFREREVAQQALAQHAADLERINSELDRFNRLAIGRELRAIELKREINSWAHKAGSPPPYDLSAVDRVAAPDEAD